MKESTNRQQKKTIDELNWDKYYSRLDAEQLMQAVIDDYMLAYSPKPGLLSYKHFNAGALVHTTDNSIVYATGDYFENCVKIPGVIWRNGKTHRLTEEPTDEQIERITEKYINRIEGNSDRQQLLKIYKKLQGSVFYSDNKEHIYTVAEPITRYITYHPLILKRIYELTAPLIYGQREDVQQLVKEYQAGNKELLQRIINQLGGIINKAQKEFSYTGNKEAFTNLAGKFNKRIPKPEKGYSDNSPAGDTEDQRLLLITEPFMFTETDLQITIEKAVEQALDSYKYNQGAKFKTWFYRIFKNDLIDLYREYQRGWKNGHIISNYEEVEERLQDINYIDTAELLKPGFMEILTDNQKRWIALFLKILPDRLTAQLTADILNISLKTEYNIRQSLQAVMENNSAALKHYNELLITERNKRNKLRKQPAINKRQSAMIAHYRKFTSYKKPFPINPDNFNYQPGTCSGSSFFPRNVIITDIIE